MVHLEESLRRQMKTNLPLLTEETRPYTSKINYYHLVNMSEAIFDQIFEDPDKLIVGRGEPPVFNLQRIEDRDKISLIGGNNEMLVLTDKPEYNYVVLMAATLKVLTDISTEPEVQRSLQNLYQTYTKILVQLRNFSQALKSVIVKIGLGEVKNV
jgi:hypothetical protein